MGVSTDADIAFGIDLGEDIQYGLPWFNEAEDENDDNWEWDEAFEEWCDKEFGEGNAPFEIVLHCSYDYSMYILALKGTHLSASRGYAEEFDPAKLLEEVPKDRVQMFKDLVEKYNIKGENDVTEPSWLLFSLWG